MVRGEGVTLTDSSGKTYTDLISSWWCCALGHSHPAIVEAIVEQAHQLQHSILGNLSHAGAENLAQKIAHLMPSPERHVFFAADGCSAVEAAMKMAIQYWDNIGRKGKYKFMSMDQSYHGDSLGALSVGFVDHFHRPFRHAVPRQITLPFPIPTEQDPAGFSEAERLIGQHSHECAAVIVEPLCQGAAGMRMYPAAYLKRLSECCKTHDLLLISDEIAMGFGHTGEMFAFHHAGIDPDIITIGKALTAGYLPASAAVVKDAVYQTFADHPNDHTFYHGNTFAGNPLACAAAVKALDIYEEIDIVSIARHMGANLEDIFKPFREIAMVKDVRHLGMIAVIEIDEKASDKVHAIRQDMLEAGYLIRPLGNVFYFMPPYIISNACLQEAGELLLKTVKKHIS